MDTIGILSKGIDDMESIVDETIPEQKNTQGDKMVGSPCLFHNVS